MKPRISKIIIVAATTASITILTTNDDAAEGDPTPPISYPDVAKKTVSENASGAIRQFTTGISYELAVVQKSRSESEAFDTTSGSSSVALGLLTEF